MTEAQKDVARVALRDFNRSASGFQASAEAAANPIWQGEVVKRINRVAVELSKVADVPLPDEIKAMAGLP